MSSMDEAGTHRAQRRGFPGARKLTPQILATRREARAYSKAPTLKVTRTLALQIAKRAAAAMGLKATKIALIDHLFGFSPAADWSNAVASPIVWPSNDTLALRLGLSVSAARYHLRGLVASGLVAHSSHPTFQRRGVRDHEGNVVEAFGIDLSPLITRYDELIQIAEAYEFVGRERKKLSYRRTQVRREIESVLESAIQLDLDGPWQHIHGRLDAIRERFVAELEDLASQVGDLEVLRDEAEDAYQLAWKDAELDTAESSFRRQQTTADFPILKESKGKRPRAIAREHHPSDAASGGIASEKKPGREAAHGQTRQSAMTVLDEDVRHISLPLVREACPVVARHNPTAFESWTKLREAGAELCTAFSINPQVWREAQTYLGPDAAIAALAVTVQRTDDGTVANSGAYLRTLVQRGRVGRLFISRSLFALANASAPPTEIAEPLPDRSFPGGTIRYGQWADLVRAHAPSPTPDVDLVADAFRTWCRKGNIDLQQPSIDKAFIGFCRKWRTH